MKARVKVWIEIEGRLVLSDWRVRFLEAIAETGSLKGASQKLGIPYRVMWGKIKEVEDRLGMKLTEGHSGGAAGGETRLTSEAQDYIDRYHRLTSGLEEEVSRRFAEIFESEGQ